MLRKRQLLKPQKCCLLHLGEEVIIIPPPPPLLLIFLPLLDMWGNTHTEFTFESTGMYSFLLGGMLAELSMRGDWEEENGFSR